MIICSLLSKNWGGENENPMHSIGCQRFCALHDLSSVSYAHEKYETSNNGSAGWACTSVLTTLLSWSVAAGPLSNLCANAAFLSILFFALAPPAVFAHHRSSLVVGYCYQFSAYKCHACVSLTLVFYEQLTCGSVSFNTVSRYLQSFSAISKFNVLIVIEVFLQTPAHDDLWLYGLLVSL